MNKQVDKNAYRFGKYTKIDRWSSYYYQIESLLASPPVSILEIGVGEGVVRDYIRNQTKIAYTSLDIAEDLLPDVVGSVDKIPLANNSFDTVCAFEILEHLPFDRFEIALQELYRVAKTRVIISLPHFGPPVKFLLKVPFLPEIKIALKVPYRKMHVFDGQHYWEIGKRGYNVSKICQAIKRYFMIEKEFVPFENQYHHFFILTKK